MYLEEPLWRAFRSDILNSSGWKAHRRRPPKLGHGRPLLRTEFLRLSAYTLLLACFVRPHLGPSAVFMPRAPSRRT